MRDLAEHLEKMRSDTVENYVIAGLDSHLLNNGCVRLFTNERDHQDSITPHSHRFDFMGAEVFGGNRTSYENPIRPELVHPEKENV